jgi:hypothetical protein
MYLISVNAKPCQILHEMIQEATMLRDKQLSASDSDQVENALFTSLQQCC